MKPTAPLLLLLTFAALGCQHVAPAPPPAAGAPTLGALHSPWDTTPVAATNAAYDCGPITPVAIEITVTGPLDGKKKYVSEDVKAAVYSQSGAAIEELVSRAVKAADFYRSSGSTEAAACTIHLLAANAQAHAMTGYMAGDEAFANRSHAIHGMAFAYLKVRGAGVASPAEIDVILDWLEDLVHIERAHYEAFACNHEHCYIRNHKGLGVAMEAAAIGIAANDPRLFGWAISQYHASVGQINNRGMLHYDTKGRYAFKNNLRSAADLVQIAELAEINNVPLYGYDNGAIHLLVHTVALGIVSPEPYKSATKTPQVAPTTVEPWEIVWASVYNRRFPDPIVTSLLQQIGPAGSDMWGGEPWDADS